MSTTGSTEIPSSDVETPQLEPPQLALVAPKDATEEQDRAIAHQLAQQRVEDAKRRSRQQSQTATIVANIQAVTGAKAAIIRQSRLPLSGNTARASRDVEPPREEDREAEQQQHEPHPALASDTIHAQVEPAALVPVASLVSYEQQYPDPRESNASTNSIAKYWLCFGVVSVFIVSIAAIVIALIISTNGSSDGNSNNGVISDPMSVGTQESSLPSATPSMSPALAPSAAPSAMPSFYPSAITSLSPSTRSPPNTPSLSPSTMPSSLPTTATLSISPTLTPLAAPSAMPSFYPSTIPSLSPSTRSPSNSPSLSPSTMPSSLPTTATLSISPTLTPLAAPSAMPSFYPSTIPSLSPSTRSPSNSPSLSPSTMPSSLPTTVGCGIIEDCPARDYGKAQECTARALEMTYYFHGGDCQNTCSIQTNQVNVVNGDNYFTCDDFNGGPPTQRRESAFIVVTDVDDDTIYHGDWVVVGNLFTLSDGGNRFPADQLIMIYSSNETSNMGNILQSMQYHSSCSQNLFLQDTFGAVQLVGLINEDQGKISCLD
ncbi:Inherit from KOG: receptor [Seminavis robusta]|uniref:Inherit from KOG: receptor n=1 Tax=Seminavis robusta TaxID=568900 RepID=A0A9N8EL63_9STRA|nr:Inherit from KOG: receptor [Seminavis robusta]|eukprot:Sro1458_g274420.1 Inherit from KOG: receptor (544) ;mRNA; f:15734-17365